MVILSQCIQIVVSMCQILCVSKGSVFSSQDVIMWRLPGRPQSRSDAWGSSWSSSVSCCSWMNPGESAHPWYEGSRVPDRCWETQKSPSQSQSWHQSTSKPGRRKKTMHLIQLNLVCNTLFIPQEFSKSSYSTEFNNEPFGLQKVKGTFISLSTE